MTEVVVVGGGIVGASAAYHLARAGVETVLVDRRDEGRATDAGAGILSAATSSRSDSDTWFAFGVDAVDYYRDLTPRLRTEQDGDVGYEPCDLLSVAVTPAEADAFDERVARLADRTESVGRPAPGSVEEVSAAEARARFPPLADVRRAFAYDGAARVDGRTFTSALRRAAEGHGLRTRETTATSIAVADGRVRAVETPDGRLDVERVVVAGGAWSAAFGDDLGVSLPVEPMRGQIAHLSVGRRDAETGADANADTGEWPIVGTYRGHYIVPWPGGRVAAGATREEGSGFDPRTTAAGVREVLDEALTTAPGLADASVEEVRVGLRPVTPDRLPVLGGVPGVEGAYLATGHGATGLQLGPYSGRVVARLARGESPEADVEPFSVSRFA